MGIFRWGHKHLPAQTLNEYLDDRLPTVARERVQQGVSGCAHCRRELDALRNTRLMLRQLPAITPRRSFFVSPAVAGVVAPPPAPRFRAPQWAYAGTASLAALVLTVMVAMDAAGLVAPGGLSQQAEHAEQMEQSAAALAVKEGPQEESFATAASPEPGAAAPFDDQAGAMESATPPDALATGFPAEVPTESPAEMAAELTVSEESAVESPLATDSADLGPTSQASSIERRSAGSTAATPAPQEAAAPAMAEPMGEAGTDQLTVQEAAAAPVEKSAPDETGAAAAASPAEDSREIPTPEAREMADAGSKDPEKARPGTEAEGTSGATTVPGPTGDGMPSAKESTGPPDVAKATAAPPAPESTSLSDAPTPAKVEPEGVAAEPVSEPPPQEAALPDAPPTPDASQRGGTPPVWRALEGAAAALTAALAALWIWQRRRARR